MSLVAKIELEKRHAARKRIMTESRLGLKPVITSKKSIKEARTLMTEQQEEFLEACFLVDHDVTCLLGALALIEQERKLDVTGYVSRAWGHLRISEEELQVLHDREMEEVREREKKEKDDEDKRAAEAEKSEKKAEKEARARGEVPGQMNINDVLEGGTAEAAGPVTVRPIDTLEAR